MNNENYVSLVHGLDKENLDDIWYDGLKTPASRGVESDIGKNTVKNNSIYLYDPDNLPEWLKDGWNDVFAEVLVPKDEVYVTKFGNEVVEEMDVEVAENKLPTYRAYEKVI